MAISPIETVTMAPKSQEASQIKGTQVQRPVHEQIILQQKMENKVRRDSEQTVRLQETRNQEYRYDAKEKGRNEHHNSQKKKNSGNVKQKKDKLQANVKEGTKFDIRI